MRVPRRCRSPRSTRLRGVTWNSSSARSCRARYDLHVLEQMVQLPELSLTEQQDEVRLTQWGAQLETLLNVNQPAGRVYRVSIQSGAIRIWS